MAHQRVKKRICKANTYLNDLYTVMRETSPLLRRLDRNRPRLLLRLPRRPDQSRRPRTPHGHTPPIVKTATNPDDEHRWDLLHKQPRLARPPHRSRQRRMAKTRPHRLRRRLTPRPHTTDQHRSRPRHLLASSSPATPENAAARDTQTYMAPPEMNTDRARRGRRTRHPLGGRTSAPVRNGDACSASHCCSNPNSRPPRQFHPADAPAGSSPTPNW